MLIGISCASCSWHDLLPSESAKAEEIDWHLKYSQWRRQQQQELSGQFLGKDKSTVLDMLGKPAGIQERSRYYDASDQLREAEEEWVYKFPKKRGLFSPAYAVHFFFDQDGKVVYVDVH